MDALRRCISGRGPCRGRRSSRDRVRFAGRALRGGRGGPEPSLPGHSSSRAR